MGSGYFLSIDFLAMQRKVKYTIFPEKCGQWMMIRDGDERFGVNGDVCKKI
jgi:hypothetical protein